ncbi:PqiC family protein [Halomonas huangheensis]|uniref:ABC-type transport auxiliary lipoprotein component domain-containing protein n=1 Tax=Halomonas huangheensis TaxID=1178482 RepID=W1NB55_9GAMM|nr:ABC-type transport auxiliary lipoprotein family protein [Halomonas huangheensis]ALM52739.1 hypothetical protein AR456_10960 [Halomonas huangheensis]ERL52723.1 hypothetical protein BJB45_15705 [Halomonas huangheensis]
MRSIWTSDLVSFPGLASKFGVIMATLLLTGCASSGVETTNYMLPADAGSADATLPATHDTTLLIARPLVAKHLDQEGIVLQLDDITLNAATTNLWAAPLPQQLERGMRERLAHRLPSTQVLLSQGNSRRDAVTLELSVDSFQGRYDGAAVASGQWILRGGDGKVQSYAPFNAEVTLNQDGYPALVRALGRSWDEVADEITAGFHSSSR